MASCAQVRIIYSCLNVEGLLFEFNSKDDVSCCKRPIRLIIGSLLHVNISIGRRVINFYHWSKICYIYYGIYISMGPGVAWWLRHSATSRTFPGFFSQ